MAASAGTPLGELDNKMSAQDGDLVQRIFADMNNGAPPPSGAPPPPLPANSPPGGYPPASTYPQTVDAMTAQAHVIGRDHPTPADFAAAIHGVDRQIGFDAAFNAPPPVQQPPPEPKKNLYGRILDESRTPLVVAFVFFLLSLPAINLLFAHYIPYLVQPSGSFTMIGLVVKSLLAGLAFWILQRVIAPLLNA